MATLLGAIPIAIATATAVAHIPGMPGPTRLGADLAGWWRTVPGHETIAGPLDWLSGVASWPPILRMIGEWSIGVAVVGAAFLVLARVGLGYWGMWDLRERREARREKPQPPRRVLPAIAFAALTTIGVAMSFFTLAIIWR